MMEITDKSTDKEKVKKLIQKLFHAMDFDVEPTIREEINDFSDEVECTFVIKSTDNAQYFIGHHGANLRAIEHLSHVVARQQGIRMRFKIDINDYRVGKMRMFEKIAKDAIDDAVRTKKPVVLRPMSPYERRIIHTIVARNESVTTDSIGEGEERKVVVKPVGVIASL